nr:polysaccharide deacetylase family protein [uncultured Methanoregula sp.]
MIECLQKNQELWDLFTRKEEYSSTIRDQYDRFPYYSSRNRNVFDPHVSKYLTEHGFLMEYPDKKPFAVCLTHDIDTLYESCATKSITALRHLSHAHIRSSMRSLGQMRSKKIPNWNFSDIMRLESRYSAKSTFFFMAENSGDRDYAYDINDCETVMGELIDGGWEIGMHGGHTTYKDPQEMSVKKQRLEKILNREVIGYRNHYLRFRVPDTWENLRNAGFKYDATLGYADCIGFRNGMCHPFKPYNIQTEKTIEILEIPLAIMDCTLYQYMKLDTATAWEITKQLIDVVERYHGVLTVLWHNTFILNDTVGLYEKILQYCSNKGAWITTGEEIAKWVNNDN